MRRIGTAIIAIFLLLPGGACPFELITGRQAGLGGTFILSGSSASEIVNLSSGSLAEGQVIVESGFRREFELKEFEQLFLAAAGRKGQFTFAAGLSQFGYRNFYAERTGRLLLGYQSDSLSVFSSLSVRSLSFGGHYPGLIAITAGVGGAWRTKHLIAAFTADNITSPTMTGSADRKTQPKYSLFGELRGRGAFSVTGRLTIEEGFKPHQALGQKIDLADGAAITWGISTEPLQYGGGLLMDYRTSTITYAVSIHPVLGISHTISFSYMFGKKHSIEADPFE